jgi:hypothetical protein
MTEAVKWVVERKLLLQTTVDGPKTPITIRIGKPYWQTEGKVAKCPVDFEGLTKVRDISGIDPLHALYSAISFVETFLKEMSDHKKFYWEDGEPFDMP